MRVRTIVAAGAAMLAVAGTLNCELSEDACVKAQKHLCSNLPNMGCSTAFMDNAVEKVRKECGDQSANAFFRRAMSQCVRGQEMDCPTD